MKKQILIKTNIFLTHIKKKLQVTKNHLQLSCYLHASSCKAPCNRLLYRMQPLAMAHAAD